MNRRDLYVIVADVDAANVVCTLLEHRQPALGIHCDFDRQFDFQKYDGRDAGCRRRFRDLLGPPRQTHRHALLLFDLHGCGDEQRSRIEIEREMEAELTRIGWPEGDAAIIVIAPELENWVWSRSPHVPRELGWGTDAAGLRGFLEQLGLWPVGQEKPCDPKEALRRAVVEKRRKGGVSAELFRSMAKCVTLEGCQDPAFQKLCQMLRRWFAAVP